MKKIAFFLIIVCSLSVAAIAQAQVQPERRVVEVSGSAEKLVIPDEFTFKITLVERIENKKKITIEDQEAALRVELARLGLDVNKDLTVFDLSSMYVRQKKVKDVLGSKDYRLELDDLNKIALLQDLADRLNVGRLDLVSARNSRMAEIRREVKIEAIKAAKAKAEYLLAAIGQRVGKPTYIKEMEEERSRFQIDGASGSSNTYVLDGVASSNDRRQDDPSLSFTAERVRFVITAKFEIE